MLQDKYTLKCFTEILEKVTNLLSEAVIGGVL